MDLFDLVQFRMNPYGDPSGFQVKRLFFDRVRVTHSMGRYKWDFDSLKESLDWYVRMQRIDLVGQIEADRRNNP